VSTHPHFIPADYAGSRKDTAVLLVGTAREFGIDQHNIRRTGSGYTITDRLLDVLIEQSDEDSGEQSGEVEVSGNDALDPGEHTIADIKSHVTEHPDEAEAILSAEQSGQNRVTLVQWLAEFTNASGNRAAKTTGTSRTEQE
jgi:hypothetical protein